MRKKHLFKYVLRKGSHFSDMLLCLKDLLIKNRIVVLFLGLSALIWFLFRVIPKPGRAMYPCQRVAFPIATSFVIWIAGTIGAFSAFKKAKYLLKNFKIIHGLSFAFLAVLLFGLIEQYSSTENASANNNIIQQLTLIDAEEVNSIVPKASVSIIQSNKTNADDIDSAEICDMVRQSIKLAGGFDTLVHDSMVVVLKPNLITAVVLDGNYDPTGTVLSQKVNAVTTDYRVIQAVVNLVRERNPHGKVYIIEGSGIGNTRDNMKKMGWLSITGVDDFICLDEACGGWRDKNAAELISVSLPPGKAKYTVAQNIYYLNRIYYNADVLISIPVLKTHSNAGMTGAVKNVGIGSTPINIYGASSSKHWRVDVIDHGDAGYFDNLHNWIHDFYMCKPVNYTIMDALTGMEHGPTPVNNDAISMKKKNTRCIMASKDPIALDAIASLIVQTDPGRIGHLVKLHNDTMGCADPKYIRVLGKRVDQIKDHYLNLATYARYTDFTPPVVSVTSYQLINDSLHLNLFSNGDLVKAEITVADTISGRIWIKNFDNMKVKLGRKGIDEKSIKILTYDRYLNCTILNLDTTVVKASYQNYKQVLKVFPNPFHNILYVEFNNQVSSNTLITIYNTTGKLFHSHVIKNFQDESKLNFNLSFLTNGNYVLNVKSGSKIQNYKIVKN